MSFQRVILHYGYDLDDFRGELSTQAVASCWFELHRQGGCGAGELRLTNPFSNRTSIQPGHWIAFEYSLGERWYLGRVEQITASSPHGLRIRLEGMGVQLNEVFPGGFAQEGQNPHRYSRTDLFSDDPDRAWETIDIIANTRDAVVKLMEQYVVPQTKIQFNTSQIEAGPASQDVTSIKFHGEESVRSAMKELAYRAGNASWGVDQFGEFYFLQPRTTTLLTLRENRDLTSLQATSDRELLFNRVMLTGDYVYDPRNQSGDQARRSYRWRGNYRQPQSVDLYGERRIRLWIPWIRTQEDSRSFVTEFFKIYAQPAERFLLQTIPQSLLPLPWSGEIKLLDREGQLLTRMQPETIRVQFDRTPTFRISLGPVDPRVHWSEPEHDERWELPENLDDGGGGEVSLSISPLPSGGEGGGGPGSSSSSPSSSSLSPSSIGSQGTSLESSLVSSMSLQSSLSSSFLSSSQWISSSSVETLSSELTESIENSSEAEPSSEVSSGQVSSASEASSGLELTSQIGSEFPSTSHPLSGTSSSGEESGMAESEPMSSSTEFSSQPSWQSSFSSLSGSHSESSSDGTAVPF